MNSISDSQDRGWQRIRRTRTTAVKHDHPSHLAERDPRTQRVGQLPHQIDREPAPSPTAGRWDRCRTPHTRCSPRRASTANSTSTSRTPVSLARSARPAHGLNPTGTDCPIWPTRVAGARSRRVERREQSNLPGAELPDSGTLDCVAPGSKRPRPWTRVFGGVAPRGSSPVPRSILSPCRNSQTHANHEAGHERVLGDAGFLAFPLSPAEGLVGEGSVGAAQPPEIPSNAVMGEQRRSTTNGVYCGPELRSSRARPAAVGRPERFRHPARLRARS